MGVRRSLLSLLRLETKNVSATSLEKLCISRDLISQKEKKTDGLWADRAYTFFSLLLWARRQAGENVINKPADI